MIPSAENKLIQMDFSVRYHLNRDELLIFKVSAKIVTWAMTMKLKKTPIFLH